MLQGISEQKRKPPSYPAPLCSYLICMIASGESLLSPMVHLMYLFSLLIVLIEPSHSYDITRRVVAILRRTSIICSQNNPTIEDFFLTGVPYLTNGVSKDERRGIRFWGDLGDTCLIQIDVWRCFQYKDSGAGELGDLSFCSEIPCSTRRVL